jgi:RNase H-fold protein (predicted Holliday junction resolvase)
MASQKLTKCLAAPAKLASTLDWRKAVGGSVMSLDIHKDRIGLAISSHPSFEQKAVCLESITLAKKGKVNQECKERLSQLVKDHKVCGFLVSFPLQQDTGRMGAACGRVLYTLDDLLSDTKIVTPNRPLCLWDSLHSTADREDEWGRCAAYTKTSDKSVHIASQEQYNQDENIVATQVWDDFCRVNWPDLSASSSSEAEAEVTAEQSSEAFDTISDSLENEQWDDSACYVKVALL